MMRHLAIVSLGLIYAVVCYGKPHDGATLKPVVLVPGITGNQLEVKLDDTDAGKKLKEKCGYGDDWRRIWLDVTFYSPFKQQHECLVELVKLHYNSEKKTFADSPGSQVRATGWGSTKTMEFIDPSWSAWLIGVGQYFHPTVQEMLSWGYVRGKNLFGAPYDFRHAPSSPENDEFYEKLATLIEQAYNNNNGQKVVLVGHSLGGLYLHHFLLEQSSRWKKHYIDSLVTAATPWKGTTFQHMILASGYDMDVSVKVFDTLLLREIHRGLESNVYLMAHKDLTNDQPIVITPEKEYTSADNLRFLEDIGFDHGPEILRQLKDSRDTNKHPGVTVHCMYNTGVDTPIQFIYGPDQFPDQEPTRIFGDGDASVPTASLRACSQWKKSERDTMTNVYELKGSKHDTIFYDPEFLAMLNEFVTVKAEGDEIKKDESWFSRLRGFLFQD